MPAWIVTIISIIQTAVKHAPDAIEFIQQAKEFIGALFGAKQIDAATQNALMAHCDAILEAFKSGAPPPAWTVEPDPATLTGLKEFDDPPSEMVIVKVEIRGELSCMINAAGKEWCVPKTAVTRTAVFKTGEVWTVGPLRFFVVKSAIA